MKRILSLVVLALLAAIAAFGQTAAANVDVKTAILKLEDAINTAKLKGDAAAIRSLYADDFVGINAGGGKTSKADQIDFYGGDGSVLAINQTDDVSVRVIGKAAIVTARLKYQYNSRMENQNVRWMRYTRIYEQRGAAWVIVAEHFVFTTDPNAKVD
jgi:ketosteroid isomerase-like protein